MSSSRHSILTQKRKFFNRFQCFWCALQNPTINAQQFADSITGAVSGADCVDQDALSNFNKALVDLMQEGSLGLLDCIAGYRPDTGNKFLTYAAPAIRNAMVDYIRRWNPTFEAKNPGSIIRLDEVVKDENKGKHEFVADSRAKNPEQIYIAKETHEKSIPHCSGLTEENGHTSGIVSALRMILSIL